MAKVVWAEPALNDLQGIILEQSPFLGRIVPEFNDQSIRELTYGSYRIIYKATDTSCSIVADIHGSLDIFTHLKSGEWNVE